MANISVKKLSLVDGAEELDLPDEAAVILDDLRNEIRGITPIVKQQGVKILYSYGTPESCGKLSSAIGRHKAQEIKKILSTVRLKPKDARMPKPEIVKVERSGVYTSQDFARLAVLISDPVGIVVKMGSKRVSHEWEPGKILLLMPDTSLQPKDKDGTGNSEAEGKGMDKPLELSDFFYTMIPVEYHHQ
ncbi:hypothetical protein FPOA_12506 [Fusarium poae]|uniref:Uncharacterized protein n=1 Tax=Fusarium poae TaxID=36050 RepID=A0A1B8A8Z7_FUSPO|nr:hypothetical protein FPOA_12506 [Fusarium poae]